MSHEIYSFAYTGEVAWHGLGNYVEEGQPLEVWEEKGGFGFEIKPANVCFRAGNEILDFPGRKVLYRSDTNAELSIVSDDYKIVQPKQILEFFRSTIEDLHFTMETVGVLKKGNVYFALAKTHRQGSVVANDIHMMYLLLCSSCDKSLATTGMLTDMRVVCANTLSGALSGRGDRVKIKHTATFDPSNVKESLGLLDYDAAFTGMMENMRTLSEIKMTPEAVDEFFVELLTGKPANEHDGTRAVRGLDMLRETYNFGKGQDDIHGTAYGALNAVTRFVDHERNRKNPLNNLHSALFGQGRKKKEEAFNTLLALAA